MGDSTGPGGPLWPMRQHPPQWPLLGLWDSPCVVPVAASGSALKGTRGALRRAERRVQSFRRFGRASTGLSESCEEGGGTTRSAPSPSTCRDRDGDGLAGRARRWREAGKGANRGAHAKAGRRANRGAHAKAGRGANRGAHAKAGRGANRGACAVGGKTSNAPHWAGRWDSPGISTVRRPSPRASGRLPARPGAESRTHHRASGPARSSPRASRFRPGLG